MGIFGFLSPRPAKEPNLPDYFYPLKSSSKWNHLVVGCSIPTTCKSQGMVTKALHLYAAMVNVIRTTIYLGGLTNGSVRRSVWGRREKPQEECNSLNTIVWIFSIMKIFSIMNFYNTRRCL